jgi:ferredoxin-thioredoxin reductase catalytic subunit
MIGKAQYSSEDVSGRYEALKQNVSVRQAECRRFIDFLERETTWLTSPASTRYHLNVEGGLLLHSVGVAETALKLRYLLAPDLGEESVVITSLFHDVGKVGHPGKPCYLPNDNLWEVRNRGRAYKVNPEIIAMNSAVRGLCLVSRFIPLTEEEAQAIVAHDGLYPVYGGVANLEYHQCECRLLMILQFADKWTAAVEEEGRL